VKTSKLLIYALLDSLGVLVYVSLVVFLINNGQKFFGPADLLGSIAILLLFVLSATVVGLLVLGRPGYLYFNGLKKEGVSLLLYTIVFLLAIMVLVFLALIIWK
jgi:hypothetical protein